LRLNANTDGTAGAKMLEYCKRYVMGGSRLARVWHT
jgi:hypothetical protein